jgi:HSP20 family molecular chaperone IbpA
MSDAIAVRENNGHLSARAYPVRRVAPPIDVFENGDEILIVADVPGVSGDGIDLRVENATLTLAAKRAPSKDESPALVREYEPADFEATFRIPAGIDTSAIAAEVKQGTLSVRLPKAAAAKPRKIAVQATS